VEQCRVNYKLPQLISLQMFNLGVLIDDKIKSAK